MGRQFMYQGFSLIDVFSPFVTYDHDNDFAFFKPRTRKGPISC